MRNLTPHAIVVRMPDGSDRTFEPHPEGPLRLDFGEPESRVLPPAPDFDVPVVIMPRPTPAALQELRKELRRHVKEAGNNRVHYGIIVPRMILEYVPDDLAYHVYAPDTGPGSVVRDKDGRIVAVRRLMVS